MRSEILEDTLTRLGYGMSIFKNGEMQAVKLNDENDLKIELTFKDLKLVDHRLISPFKYFKFKKDIISLDLMFKTMERDIKKIKEVKLNEKSNS